MDEIAKKLNITNHEGWYKATFKMLKTHGATGLLSKYKDSPSLLLTTVYPEYQERLDICSDPFSSFSLGNDSCKEKELNGSLQAVKNLLKPSLFRYNWDYSKFTQVPRGYWEVLSNQRALLHDIAQKLSTLKKKSSCNRFYQTSENYPIGISSPRNNFIKLEEESC